MQKGLGSSIISKEMSGIIRNHQKAIKLSFTQLLEVVANSTCQLEGFTWGPSQAHKVWQELQPSLARMGRLEELVSWWRPIQP